MATFQDVIRRITITATGQGVDQTTASLQKLAAAQGGVAVATAETDKATLSAQSRLNSLQRSVDTAYASEVRMAQVEKTLTAARNEGLISAERENELLSLSAAKYTEAGAAAELMAKGEEIAGEAAKGLLASLGPLLALTALAELPNKIIETAENVSKIGENAEVIGTTAKNLQELDFAATQYSVSADTMNSALERFTKNIGIAQTGTGVLAKVLKANGIGITGNTVSDLENYANLIERATTAEQRNFLITTAFGKGSSDLGNLFRDGADGIQEMIDKADAANVVLSDGTIESAHQLNQEFQSLETQLNATFEEFIINIAPTLEATLQGLTNIVRAANAVVDVGKTAWDTAQNANLPISQQSTEYLQHQVAVQQSLLAQVANDPHGYAAGAFGQNTAGHQAALATAQAELAKRGGADINSFIAGNDGLNGGWGTLPPPAKLPPPPPDAGAAAAAKAYERTKDAIELQTKALTETDLQKEIDDELSKAHVSAMSDEGQHLTALTTEYYNQKLAVKAVDDATGFFAQTAESAFEGMITGGESLTDVLGDVEKALMNAVIQAEILGTGPLAGILGTAPTTAGQTGGLAGSIGSFISGLIHPNAMGGTYQSASLAAYANSVVSSPTFFKFASGGAVGVAGEAGPEAIMPLKRGADGRLGVAAANGNAPTFNLTIVTAPGQTADVSQKKNSTGGLDITAVIKGAVKTAVADGSMDGVMQQTYGLKRVGRT